MPINWQSYTNAYPDLLEYYNTSVAPTGQSLEDWAQSHWLSHGQYEGRTIPGATPTDLAELTGTTVPGTTTGGTTSTTTPTTTTAGGNNTSNFGTNINDLIEGTGMGGLIDPATGVLSGGISRAGVGGNTNQVQGGLQTGQYANQNNTSQSGTQIGTQTTSGTQTGTQTSTQNQTGSQDTTQNVTGTTGTTQNQTGTTTSGVNANAYGLGNAFQRLLDGAQGLDDTQRATLTQIMQTGNPYMQEQVTQAVKQATSGPSMTRAGTGANDRAAAWAAQGVAQNAVQNQLAAAGLVGQSSATGTAIGQGAPLAGTTTSTNQNTTGSQTTNQNVTGNTTSNNTTTGSGTNSTATTGAQSTNQSGVQNTSQTGTGAAAGGSIAAATGTVPQQSSSGGGGCFACTAYVELGEMHPGVIRRAAKWKIDNFQRYGRSLRGYSAYGPWLAETILSSGDFARLFKPVARGVLYEEYRLATQRVRFKLSAWLVHAVFDYGSLLFAPFGKFSYKQKTIGLLKKYNLYFQF